jgi:peptidyl-prolyl cis-trans isomerase SurA
MAKQFFLATLFICLISTSIFAQTEDPVLFTVNNTPVHVSEFEYIYTKTNGKAADFSKKSLNEYLDLYVKFKLKVERAKEMQLDTIPQLRSELDGYRRQLADSYLIDKEVTEKLIREAYDRAQQDVNISHILFRVAPTATPQDTLKAFLKAKDAKKRIENGESFAAVAKAVSEDKSVAKNEGNIGFLTVLFPKGFYPLETAAYTQELGKLSDPIRTSAGYHILKVNGRRPARGQMEAAHILLRVKGTDEAQVKSKIDSLHKALQNGADFAALARQHSQDRNTASKGGNVGIFGVNRFERAFEDAAFSIPEDDAISDPIRTSIGWHIIKRISKKDIQPYNIEKNRLGKQVQEDLRYEAAKKAMVENIKTNAGFQEEKMVLDNYIASLNDTFLTFRWRAPKTPATETLFTLGDDMTVTLGDFTNYLGKSSRERLRKGRNNTPESVARNLYDAFVNQQCMAYEEQQLENKYPEFKALMREYQEGILLFEATKIEVWDKASTDTVGLKSFFKTIEGKYRWEERAVVHEYQLRVADNKQAREIADFARENPVEKVLETYNTDEKVKVVATEKTYEKSRNKAFNNIKWEIGAMTFPEKKSRKPYYEFLIIKDLLPVSNKTLKEARGYIVADYQDQLETEWVDMLRKAYPVKVNKDVLKGMIKK